MCIQLQFRNYPRPGVFATEIPLFEKMGFPYTGRTGTDAAPGSVPASR